jgi:hypothetical protein
MAWSPDSDAFYITEGVGAVGGYLTRVYRVEDNKIERLPDIDRTVQIALDRNHKCKDEVSGEVTPPKYLNVAAVRWLDGSNALLAVGEIPPTGECGEQSGYFEGFMVSLTSGEILKRYSPQTVISRWGKVVGDRLTSDLQAITESDSTAPTKTAAP